MTFRTPGGQTGHDAYVYEAAAIANAQRELGDRLKRLLEVAHTEAPEMFKNSTDWHPQLTSPRADAGSFLAYICRRGEESV